MTQEFDSEQYWESRYATRAYREFGNSGEGSYGDCARYKADFVNRFIRENSITTVIELGCGDGAQLDLAEYPQYIGVDISPRALDICRKSFEDDFTKCFIAYDLLYDTPSQDLALSMDVIFHLIEEGVYRKYLHDLFMLSHKYVLIYSSNKEERNSAPHVFHRRFTAYIEQYLPHWSLIHHEQNLPKCIEMQTDSRFFLYEKTLKR